MAETASELLAKWRAQGDACAKQPGAKPLKEGYVWRKVGGVCVQEKAYPGTNITDSDTSKLAARGLRADNSVEETIAIEEAYDQIEEEIQESIKPVSTIRLKSIPAAGVNVNNATLRYPASPTIDAYSDYVSFQFFKYSPPFRNAVASSVTTQNGVRSAFDYNQVSMYSKDNSLGETIVMYMPPDISTGFRSNWGGKAMSNLTRGLLQSAGGDGMAKLNNLGQTFGDTVARAPAMIGAMAIRKAVQKITGDSLTNNDVFGSISGAILNPNVELLFEGMDLRNFSLKFKLVPRNSTETENINNIVKSFKKAMLPSNTSTVVFGMKNAALEGGFIDVPSLCRVAFMQGSNEHPHLPRFKMCAITQVDVNYTPDGSYATYADGQPVAIDLTLNFQETKMVFKEDIDAGIA